MELVFIIIFMKTIIPVTTIIMASVKGILVFD
jgi:hypothetical protein